MSPATRGLLAVLTAALWAWPTAAPSEPLQGALELAPLAADPRPERPALARVTDERGPLWPWVDSDALRLGVGDVTPVVVLGGACPLDARFGVLVRLENHGAGDAEVTLGDAEPVTVEPGQHVVAEPAGATTLVTDAANGWACTLHWESGPAAVSVPARRAGPGRFEADFGEIAARVEAEPEVGRPGSHDVLPLHLWYRGRPVCADPSTVPPASCQWTARVESDGGELTLEPVRLRAEALPGAAEGP